LRTLRGAAGGKHAPPVGDDGAVLRSLGFRMVEPKQNANAATTLVADSFCLRAIPADFGHKIAGCAQW